ncbi:hypothetical protein WN51_10344 [Melipona quadrifasciata]|uniref:Uncharacterized protein n=1 Tax=Melipona quadrifasciata TaxID=166423 RepID=A0A0M9A8B9_9HYME|nr:hypothetical protein WN51_10344 [Melipona quadrifasciata]
MLALDHAFLSRHLSTPFVDHSHRMCTTAIKINILEKGFRSYTPYGCNNRERMKKEKKKTNV